MKISIDHNTDEVVRAFTKAPGVMMKAIDRKLERGALEVAREARINAPKARSLLTNSIRSSRVRLGEYLVSPGVAYAAPVEEGTRGGGWPSKQVLAVWMSAHGIDESLNYVIARAIARKGTRAQPFMEPALESKTSRVMDLVRQGVDEGLKKVAAMG